MHVQPDAPVGERSDVMPGGTTTTPTQVSARAGANGSGWPVDCHVVVVVVVGVVVCFLNPV